MNLKEKIMGEFKEAFKKGDKTKTSVLKMLQAEIHNAEIAKRTKLSKQREAPTLRSEPRFENVGESLLSDEEIIDVVLREIKKRKDAIGLYEKGGRPELAEKEKKETEILMVYLPEQLSEEEIRKLVKKAIEEIGAKETKETGKIMSILMPQIKGRADNSLISGIIKEMLTP